MFMIKYRATLASLKTKQISFFTVHALYTFAFENAINETALKIMNGR